ncbi:MAG: M36 family metallopeptidase, partial [Chloroflexaceae bacterium]|nr:M36 family metallopeptidase [Chloroflexaceae bacterium]
MSNDSLLVNGTLVERDPRTGVPRDIRSDFELPLSDSAEDSVKSFLVAHADELNLSVSGDDLQTIKATVTLTSTICRFRQQKDGIPIFGTEILVQLASSRRVRQLNLEHVAWPQVMTPRGDAAPLSQEAARKAATVATCGFAGTAQAIIDGERVTRTLHQIGKVGTKYRLEGPFVKVLNSPEETNKNNFTYASNQDGFEAVMGYYHLDSLQRYIQNTLGITTAHNSQVNVVPHANQSYASYNPGDDTIRLGHSGVCKPDRGEDAEAMIHEYGHGLQSDMVPGWGDSANPTTHRYETGAMGEGFGDILACAYFAPDRPFQREVFEDWCFADEGGMCRVDGTKVYPWNIASGAGGDWLNNVHDDGEIWSSALWNIFLDTGGGDPTNVVNCRAARDELLKTLILSHTRVPANGTMPKGAEAYMDENHDLPEYRLRYGRQILDNFHERGLLHCTEGSNLRVESLWSQQNELPEAGWQQVEYGQDNWFYARVRNTGTATTRAFVVTFSFKSPFSTPVFPDDFRNNVISAAVGYNLAPGATMTLRARWPKKQIPPIPTGATERHGCLFAEVYNPVDHVAAGVTAIGASHGKLAQCNTNIINLVPDEEIDYFFVVSNPLIIRETLVRLEVMRPPRWPNLEVTLHHRDPRVIKNLWQQMQRIELRPTLPGGGNIVRVEIVFPPGRVAQVPVMPRSPEQLTFGLRLRVPRQAQAGEVLRLDLVQRDS